MLDSVTIAVSPESYEAFLRLRVTSWREAAEKLIASIDSNYKRGLTAQQVVDLAMQMAHVADSHDGETAWVDLIARKSADRDALAQKLRLTAKMADAVLAASKC